jgi:hypothetical protein
MRPAIRAFLVLLFAFPAVLMAWGEKGHYIASEAATWNVPAGMPAFFHQAYPHLVYMGYDPDRLRNAGNSLHAVNPPNHYFDYEYVEHLEIPADRYRFIDLLYSSDTLRRLGISNTAPGFLPFKVAEMGDMMVVQWRLWRASTDPIERQRIEQNIIALAGEVGHYIADSANPHHTTVHYNGWVGDPSHGFRNDCGTHSRFETQFVSRNVTLADVVPFLAPPQRHRDWFQMSLGFVQETNTLVEPLYTLDRDGAFDGDGTAEGKEFAARRLAAGASLLRDLWWSTWLESADPPARRRRD